MLSPATMATDRISGLPDGILHHVLSFLPLDGAVRTSVLSSRWRRLWCSNPVLRFKFSFDESDNRDVASIVDHCLHVCSPIPKLRSAIFPTHDAGDALTRWIRFAAERAVEVLVIRRHYESPPFYLPPLLFECSSISSLKIQCSRFPSPMPPVVLPSLQTLDFDRVDFSNGDLNALLACLPSLENLTLTLCRSVSRLAISSPVMRELVVHKCFGLCRFEIVSASNLRVLKYNGPLSILGPLNGIPNLEEANLRSNESCNFNNRLQWEELISTISGAKILCIDTWFLRFFLDLGTRRINAFNSLKDLHLWPIPNSFMGDSSSKSEPFTGASIRALASALKSCPSLQLLCIHVFESRIAFFVSYVNRVDVVEEGEAENVEDDDDDPLEEFEGVGYTLPSLKMVNLIEYSGKRFENRLMRFLLVKAVNLQSMSLIYEPNGEDKLHWMQQEVNSWCIASPTACVSLSEYDDVCPKDEMFSNDESD
ncbi:F-box/LRR-repeat protein At3g26922-like [Typha latifolia]|uniref:F-box/LRR-repeat protein At3g26922-like n=1 Tax=Typha latifolia TaxID=4733 RepID=UPI003C3003E6